MSLSFSVFPFRYLSVISFVCFFISFFCRLLCFFSFPFLRFFICSLFRCYVSLSLSVSVSLFSPGSRWFSLGCRWLSLASRWFSLGSRWFSLDFCWFSLGYRCCSLGSRWFSLGSRWFPPGSRRWSFFLAGFSRGAAASAQLVKQRVSQQRRTRNADESSSFKLVRFFVSLIRYFGFLFLYLFISPLLWFYKLFRLFNYLIVRDSVSQLIYLFVFQLLGFGVPLLLCFFKLFHCLAVSMFLYLFVV